MPPCNQKPLSRETVRLALLHAQGVEGNRPNPAEKQDVLGAIETMGQLQIDTINVVARSPYFVLWTRLGDYDPFWLEELLEEGAIYEAWSHEACFLPSSDLHNTRARIHHPHSWRKSLRKLLDEHRVSADTLLRQIETVGPVRSSDFENPDDKRGGWWDWKHEKLLLEALFASGELMVTRRHRFQRVYDLTHRVHPRITTLEQPSTDDMIAAYVLKTIKALGVAHHRWIADYYRLMVADVNRVLPGLVADGSVTETSIAGLAGTAYVDSTHAPLVEAIEAGSEKATRTTLLSPFDPVVWDRRRNEELFDFVYRIECYTPEAKRQFGYFCLPLLHRGELVGRLDAKAHRKDERFEVKSLHLEPDVKPDDSLIRGLATALIDCAIWHKTPEVMITTSTPAGMRRSLGAEVKRQLKSRRLATASSSVL